MMIVNEITFIRKIVKESPLHKLCLKVTMEAFGNWSNPWNTQSLAGWLDMACNYDRSTSVPIHTLKILTAAVRKRRNGVMMFLLVGDPVMSSKARWTFGLLPLNRIKFLSFSHNAALIFSAFPICFGKLRILSTTQNKEGGSVR